jgi:large subunit ribosomal protein L4
MAKKKQTAEAAGAAAYQVIAPEDIALDKEQKVTVSPVGFSQCVRALLQNWRQGTVACKGRSDVAFSNKKPWKQKGTGRARAGSARSPLWRKGGVIFGPQARTRTLTVPQSLRRAVCKGLLWDYVEGQRVLSLNWVPQGDTPKTAHAVKALHEAGIKSKRIALFVSPEDRLTHASFANVPNVRMFLFDQPNAYDLANNELWVFLDKDREAFKKMVSTWL